ncbi:MAG TPA: ABC transporter substrate binding protein, partial [Blastocatellia bacterium]|nr:ABC transporter substrate binding protein [Blastocatellia bacterium]
MAPAQQAIAPKGILVLNWYNKDYSGNVAFDHGFQSVLKSAPAGSIEYYSEYLETNRFPGDDQAVALRDYLRRKYAQRSIDVVVATADPPLDFLLKYRADLFPHAPIIFGAARSPSAKELAAGPGMTGLINHQSYRKNLDLALSLHPGTEHVFIVSGSLGHDKRHETVAREDLQGYENKVSITYLTDLTSDELALRMKSLPERSIVLYVWQQAYDEKGKILETQDILPFITNSTTVPIYGQASWQVGKGVVGGYVRSSESNGKRLAEIALRIANGERAQDIPVEKNPIVPMFDWRQLQRWGIGENRLPHDGIVLFKESTFWGQYKGRIIGVFALFVVQTLLIAFLLLERARRQRAMRGLRESEERFSKVFHSSPQPISIASIEEGRYIDVNERFLEMSGYTREELIGHTSLDLNIWDGIAAREELVGPLKEGKSVRNLETKLWAKNGHFRFLLSSAELIELGGRPRVLVASSDITERKRAEESLNRLNTELEQRVADRTAALDAKARELETFAYSVAHDLKA